jgi:hypothetical protein
VARSSYGFHALGGGGKSEGEIRFSERTGFALITSLYHILNPLGGIFFAPKSLSLGSIKPCTALFPLIFSSSNLLSFHIEIDGGHQF